MRWYEPHWQGLLFLIHTSNKNRSNDLEEMNENAQTTAYGDQNGDNGSGQSSSGQSAGQSGEPQSTPAGRSGVRPSIFERLMARLRPRNGSSLREDLADA